MRKIFILSMWRSGTSWLEDILGKNVDGSQLFGHEQQILPLLAMYKSCYAKTPSDIRQKANKPIDDIDDFHLEFGYKQHKVLHNMFKYSNEPFNDFAFRFTQFLLLPYKLNDDVEQVVEKSPENLCPEVFNMTLEVFGNRPYYSLVYLKRNFLPYLASCYYKFVKKGKNDLNYYTQKWINWNSNALSQQIPNNLYYVSYESLVEDPESVVSKFADIWKTDIKIRSNVLNKWKDAECVDDIIKLYEHNQNVIDAIENQFKNKLTKNNQKLIDTD